MPTTEEEIQSEQRAQARQVREDAELLEGLMLHKGWPRFKALVEAVAQNYYATAMKPLEKLDDAVRVEYAKGTLNGLTLAASLPHLKMQEAQNLGQRSYTEE